MRRARAAAGVLLGYAVITLVMTRPYVDLGAPGSTAYPGDARLMIWTLAWDNHAVLDGVPLLDANIFYPAGHSLRYNDPLLGISLFTLPIYAATRNPILAYTVVFLLAFLLNALAMFALALRWTHRPLAAFIGGLVYAFSFYMMLHAHGHLSLIWAWPLPLGVLLLERWIARPTLGRALAWGAVLLLQILASWYLAVIAVVGTGVFGAWRHVAEVRDRWRARSWQLVVVGALLVACVWPLAAPYRDSLGTPGLEEVRSLSADWASYLVPPGNTAVGRWWEASIGPAPRWIWGELTMFLGWTALALAAVGVGALAWRRDWRIAGGVLCVALVGLVLSFGPGATGSTFGGVFGLLRALPGVAGFRAPARFGLLVLFGVALLAAWGAATVASRFGRRGEVALLVLVPVMLAEWYVVDFPLGRPGSAAIPAIYQRPEIASAHAIVSLPDYRGTDNWSLGADYLLYSTLHWRPIVNGYGRAEPPDQGHVISHMRAFPGPNNARTMRELGVDYLVLHAGRYPDGAAGLMAEALARPEYELVARDGTDYLFHVRPDATAPEPAADGQ